MAFLTQALGARPKQGMELIQQAMGLLSQAARVDSRLAPVVEAAMRILVRGPSQADGSPAGAGGQSTIIGPAQMQSPFTPNRGPMG